MDAQASSSGSVFSPDDYINLRFNNLVREYGKKTTHLVMMRLLFPCGQHRSIRKILIDTEVPLQGRSCPFNPQEIKSITEKSPEDLAITVMNKILQALWQKGVNDPGDELRELLKKIKDERNFVSHEEPHMSDTDLEHKLRSFQVMIEETLEKTKSFLSKRSAAIDELKAEIQDAVSKLLEKIREKYDLSNPQDRQRFQKQIKEFWSQLSDMIQESCEAELLSLNEGLCQILPYDWLAQYGTTDPEQITVPLQVKGLYFNSIVNQNEILNQDKLGRNPKVVIISGDAGSGKTTILCSYVEGWCKKIMDNPELSSFPLLLCMQFRNHDHNNFDDYLKGMIPRTSALFPFELVKSVVLDSKCLVLCDGYDEANENSRKLFQEFLKLNSKNMKFVVTTLPGNTLALRKIVDKAKCSRINLKVLGLREEDMKLLTEKLIAHLLKDDVTQQEQMKKELLQKIEELKNGTRAILQTPLYFNLFVLLYIECPDLRDEMSTRASVYLQLRRHKIKRIFDKTGISEESLEEFDALYRKWCLKHYIEKKYELSKADVRSCKREIISPEVLQNFDAIMSSYFSIKKTKKHLEVVNVYYYRHKTEQEFAAAGSICDDIVTSSGRTRGNIVLDVLLRSHLKCEDNDGDEVGYLFKRFRAEVRYLFKRFKDEVRYLFKRFRDRDIVKLISEFRGVISFIPGILYSTERRDVLYDTIDDIHELYVSYSLSGFDCDTLLDQCIETRLDDKVLESLVSQMKRKTHLKDQVRFQEPKSLYVLPSLLPKLRPKKIIMSFSPIKRSSIPDLNKSLKSAAQNNIHAEVYLKMNSSECAQLPGQEEEEEVLPLMDNLDLTIWGDVYEDLERPRRPFSLLTPPKESLNLWYQLFATPPYCDLTIADFINRTFPTTREEGGGGGGGGRGSTDLGIYLPVDFVADVKILLQSLTLLPPLREMIVSFPSFVYVGTDFLGDDYLKELKQLCKNKGVKRLFGFGELLVNADSEEGEYANNNQKEKRAKGKKEKMKKGRRTLLSLVKIFR